MTAQQTVLVVDDEPMVREVLTQYLARDGFEVVEASDGAAALDAFERSSIDLVLLDLMLPEVHGLEVLRRLRATADVPVILLTALGDERDRVAGLELGADDYVVKPFSPREVAARVRSVLRRSGRPESPVTIEFGDVFLDVERRVVQRDGEDLELTRLEFELLVFLASNPGRVVSRDEALRSVWDSSPEWQDPATVTVHVRRLRQKLEVNPSEPVHLLTAYGIGYRFEP